MREYFRMVQNETRENTAIYKAFYEINPHKILYHILAVPVPYGGKMTARNPARVGAPFSFPFHSMHGKAHDPPWRFLSYKRKGRQGKPPVALHSLAIRFCAIL